MKKQIAKVTYHGWSIRDYKLALSIYGADIMISIKGGIINSAML